MIKSLSICLLLFVGQSALAARLSINSTNDYIFTEIRFTNGICGVGLGTHGSNTVMRFEDLAFISEAQRERTFCASFPSGLTNSVPRFNPELSPFIYQSPDVWDILTIFQDYLSSTNSCRVISEDRLQDVDWTVHGPKDDYIGVAILFKPEGRDPFKGFVRVTEWLKLTNDADRAYRKIPVLTNLTGIAYENIARGKYALTEERDIDSEATGYKRRESVNTHTYQLDTERGWIDLANTNYVTESHLDTKKLDQITWYDYYTFRKIQYFDDRWGWGVQHGFYERSDVDSPEGGSSVPVGVDFQLFEGQRFLSVSHAFLTATVRFYRSIDDYGREYVYTNLMSGTWYVPIAANLSQDGTSITADVDPRDVANRLVSSQGLVLPASDGPALSDMIHYPSSSEYGERYSYVSSQFDITINSLCAILEVQWRARVIDD